MDLRWLGSVALLVIIGIAALFLCPIAHGSYSATHGPITSLRENRLRTFVLLALAALAALIAKLLVLFAAILTLWLLAKVVELFPPPAVSAPLRR